MHNTQRSPAAPSRREALFGFLGAGIGTAITATYYNSECMYANLRVWWVM